MEGVCLAAVDIVGRANELSDFFLTKEATPFIGEPGGSESPTLASVGRSDKLDIDHSVSCVTDAVGFNPASLVEELATGTIEGSDFLGIRDGLPGVVGVGITVSN